MKRVALVTGGSRGIGLGIATQLAIAGFDLAINGMREESAVAEVIKDLKLRGSNVFYVRGNLASAEDRNNMIGAVRNHYGRLHLLVNNAGMAPRERRDILEGTEESFDEVLSTNLEGTYFLTQKAANPRSNKEGRPELCRDDRHLIFYFGHRSVGESRRVLRIEGWTEHDNPVVRHQTR